MTIFQWILQNDNFYRSAFQSIFNYIIVKYQNEAQGYTLYLWEFYY